MPHTEIVDRVGSSERTIKNRVERMLEDGVIERLTVTTRTGNVVVVVDVADTGNASELVTRARAKDEVIGTKTRLISDERSGGGQFVRSKSSTDRSTVE